MPQKNLPIFTLPKLNEVPVVIYKSRFLIAILSAVILLLASCSKEALIEQNQSLLAQYFEENILNKDFVVQLATDNGNNLTADFNNFTFKLTKSTLLNGPMTATGNSQTYTGTWSSNDDYSKLVITLPLTVPSFSFLNREWKFTKKAIPTMELAPWGTTEPMVLHMKRL